MDRLVSTTLSSEHDEVVWNQFYCFSTINEYYESMTTDYRDPRFRVPYLALQPKDDPLHQGKQREHINVEAFSQNPFLIYMETQFGNHFGFYEGNLMEVFQSKSCYTYPAKVAVEFFQQVQIEYAT